MSINPKFIITQEINTRIAKIEEIRSFVKYSNILPEIELNLRFRATVESIHSSTSVEGNPLNKKQVEKVITGIPVTASDYAVVEVSNYKQALDWILKQPSSSIIDTASVLNLHKITMKELLPLKKVGNWRPGNVFIVDEVNGKEIVKYTGPKADKVKLLSKELFNWLEQQKGTELHPVLAAGILHYVFVSIHPFSDGNGRVTRLLTKYYLQQSKYDFKGTLTLDSYYLQNREQYYEVLSLGTTYESRTTTDITSFLDFFTKGFLDSAQKLQHDIEATGVQSFSGATIRLDQDEIAILDYTRQFGSVTPIEIEEAFDITYRTSQRKLQKLVNKKLLKQKGKGRGTHYILKNL